MVDLRVSDAAVAIRLAPAYQNAESFAHDPLLIQLTEAVKTAAHDFVANPEELRFLPDLPGHDVAARVLDLLGPPPAPQPLHVVQVGGDPDPFVATLPRLVHHRPWVSDMTVLTHLNALAGSAIFDFLSWQRMRHAATVLLVDQQTEGRVGDLPDSLTAVALRLGTGGVCVGQRGIGPPPALGHRVLSGTRPCDSWRMFVEDVAAGRIAVADTIVLHTAGDGQEGWVLLRVDGLPRVRVETLR